MAVCATNTRTFRKSQGRKVWFEMPQKRDWFFKALDDEAKWKDWAKEENVKFPIFEKS